MERRIQKYAIIVLLVIMLGGLAESEEQDKNSPELPHSEYSIPLYNQIITGISDTVSASAPTFF